MKRTHYIDEQELVSPLFQLLLIGISILCLSYIYYKKQTIFQASDERPDLIIISPKTYQTFGAFPGIIQTGLYIYEFQKFNITQNEFVFNGTIWFLFNPGVISLTTLQKFSFDKGTILYMSLPNTQLLNGKLLVRYNIRVEFNSPIDYRLFPLDNHTLYLVLNHQFVSPGEILFDSSTTDFLPALNVATFGWQQINKTATPGYAQAVLDPYDNKKTFYYPITVFSIDYVRSGIRYALSIILPLLLIFYLTIFSVSLNPSSQIALTTGGITAVLAYRFVIESISPMVGYFMLSDYIFFLILVALCLVFLLSIIDMFAVHIPLRYKKISIGIIHGIVIGMQAYWLMFWK